MNRRIFIKLLGLTPFAGLLGCKKEPEFSKADIEEIVKACEPGFRDTEFDLTKPCSRYMTDVKTKDVETVSKLLRNNAYRALPAEYHKNITISASRHRKSVDSWLVGWSYYPNYV